MKTTPFAINLTHIPGERPSNLMGVGSKTRPIGPQSGAGFLITSESGAKWFNHGSKWGGILNHVRKVGVELVVIPESRF